MRTFDLAVMDSDQARVWQLIPTTLEAHRNYRVTLTADDSRSWSAESSDLFGCLLKLRGELDRAKIRLGCMGCREDAWASGMMRDMGQGLSVYLLKDAVEGERPPQAGTFDPAPVEDTVTVEAQIAWYQSWLERRANRQ